MAYPSTIATLTNPLATDKLNSPAHHTVETNQNTEIVALETFVGTVSSAAGTLIYDVRATASDGGGHVQSANKGGTGQTAYAKGDMLVATSASVLAKLAVSSVNGYVLTSDSTQNAGVKWNVLTSAVPAWVDEGSLAFNGTANQTLTFNNAGKDIYQIFYRLQGSSNILMRLNGVVSSTYGYVYQAGNALADDGSTNSYFLLSSPGDIIVGQMTIGGKHTAGVKVLTNSMGATSNGGVHLINGKLTGDSNNLSSLSILTQGASVIGSVHGYSLTL